jgi:hypothetical protein
VRLDAVVLHRVDDQSSPPTSDVEHAFAMLQPQLPAKVIQLPFLGRVQIVAGIREIRAGVRIFHIHLAGDHRGDCQRDVHEHTDSD